MGLALPSFADEPHAITTPTPERYLVTNKGLVPICRKLVQPPKEMRITDAKGNFIFMTEQMFGMKCKSENASVDCFAYRGVDGEIWCESNTSFLGKGLCKIVRQPDGDFHTECNIGSGVGKVSCLADFGNNESLGISWTAPENWPDAEVSYCRTPSREEINWSLLIDAIPGGTLDAAGVITSTNDPVFNLHYNNDSCEWTCRHQGGSTDFYAGGKRFKLGCNVDPSGKVFLSSELDMSGANYKCPVRFGINDKKLTWDVTHQMGSINSGFTGSCCPSDKSYDIFFRLEVVPKYRRRSR